MSEPVMNELSSEARKRVAAASTPDEESPAWECKRRSHATVAACSGVLAGSSSIGVSTTVRDRLAASTPGGDMAGRAGGGAEPASVSIWRQETPSLKMR